MLDESHLKDLLSNRAYTKTDKMLICLASGAMPAHSVSSVKQLAMAHGLQACKLWNVSDLLRRSDSRAVRTDAGWELTTSGREHVLTLVGEIAASPVPQIAGTLRAHLPNLTNEDTRRFVEEGVACFEHGLYRSAVVLTWVGAVAVLQQHVVANHLSQFNQKSTARDPKWKTAKTSEELGRMKESAFLQILEDISMIGKNVKQELEARLTLRNSCGHPNQLKLAQNTTAAHIESLILNVFQNFG